MAGSFVKAIHDYHSNQPGDLRFEVGAIIKILNRVDDNWISGEHNGDIGLFPANFVEPTSAVVSHDSVEKTVVAKETYISGEDGVLTFFRGDVITFLGPVDDYWCQGSFNGEIGLFPAFAVDGLGDSSSDSTETSAEIEPKRPPLQQSPATPAVPVIHREPCAETLFEFQGFSDFELSFPAGEIIFLIKDADTDWFKGSYNERSGFFPKSFVKVLVPLPADDARADSPDIAVPHAVAIYPFVGETATELSFREGDIIYLHDWVSPEWIQGEVDGTTGIFPSSFVHIQVELPQTFPDPSSSEPEWAKRNDLEEEDHFRTEENTPDSTFEIGDTAVAIYSFSTNTKGDLSLEVGDLITIKNIIDEEWVEGWKNGAEVGFCPAVFLELKEGLLRSDTSLKDQGFLGTISPSTPSVSNQFANTDDLSVFNIEIQDANQHTGTTCSVEEGSPPSPHYISEVSPAEIPDRTKPHATSVGTVPSESNQVVSLKTVSDRPDIAPKPEFLKKPGKPIIAHKPVHLTKTKSSLTGHSSAGVAPRQQLVLSAKQADDQTAIQSAKHAQVTVSDKIKPVTQRVTKQQKPSLTTQSSSNNWVMFEDPDESYSFAEQTMSIHGPKPTQTNSNESNSTVSTNKALEQSHDFSYKSLLEKSLKNDPVSPADEEGTRNRNPRPKPPPRLDLLQETSSNGGLSLSDKLEQQAEEFEKSSQPTRKASPSLNELRAASQNSKGARPVPARRFKPQVRPSSYHSDTDLGQDKSESAFPVLDELDERITKLTNELQKETKVLSGVEVLVQMVNKDTSKREELESKKGITERKIENLKNQLKKTEDQKKRLVKLVDGYSSQLDIKLKIEQLQDTVKENVEMKNNLLSMLSNNDEDEETAKELQENISFCDRAIENTNTELEPLIGVLHQLEGGYKESSPAKEKDVNLRKKVIDEILQTEKSFGSDLNLCVKHFMMQLIEWKVDKVDCDVLFGNMPEVAALSSRFLQKLETTTNDVDINDQIIGNCFVDFSDEITTVYGRYCRNHDDAISFIEKSASNEEIQQYFRKCMESIREYSNCWDLSSFLIKPVQRILKYPLLLNELLKNTPNHHPDTPGLIKAIDVITTAASDVNEFKRRKDLVQKYQKVEGSGLSTKFQKFTWHSVLKKSSRFNQRITQFTGLVSQTVDERFNETERVFYQIEKTIKNFIKNAVQYMEQFEAVHANQVQTAENIINFYQEMANIHDVKEYHDAQKYIGENLVDDLRRVLDAEVLSPLNSLMHLFQGPHRLILKRHDKCLDYDSLANKIEKIKDRERWKQAKEELDLAKKNYEALNVQLLDELPVFNSKALVFLQTCITNFAHVHKNFFVKALDQFSPSVQLSVVNSEGDGIVSDFASQNKLATHEIFQLMFTPKKQSPAGSKPNRPAASPKTGREHLSAEEKPLKTRSLKRSASDTKRSARSPLLDDGGGIVRSHTVSVTDRSLLKKKVETRTEAIPVLRVDDSPIRESENATYIVMFEFHAEAQTELSVNKNDQVKVLQFHDNFGNSEWWRVTHGGKTGYVPSSFLTLPTTGQTGGFLTLPGAVNFTKVGSGDGMLVYSPPEYIAQYDFEACGAREVSLEVGDVVKVLQQHDLSGNNEWWSAEVNGKHGYVPASYLARR